MNVETLIKAGCSPYCLPEKMRLWLLIAMISAPINVMQDASLHLKTAL